MPIDESSLTEAVIEEQPIDDQLPPVTFEIVEGASKRGQKKLFDSRGYSYCVKRRRNQVTDWHCSLRGKANHCPASVIQRPEGFSIGIDHNHAGEVGLPETAKLTAAIKRMGHLSCVVHPLLSCSQLTPSSAKATTPSKFRSCLYLCQAKESTTTRRC